jgi:hypothetical protein
VECAAAPCAARTMKGSPVKRRWPIVPFVLATVFVAASAAIWFSIHRAALIDRASLHDRETAKEEEAIGEILQSGYLPLPDFLKDLMPPVEVPDPELISPVATAVLSGRPTFRWKRLEGQWTYVIRVFNPTLEVVAASEEIAATEWTPATELPPGITYQWQIAARHGSERVTFPKPPQSPPRFRAVDSATSARLRELAKNRAGVHLLLAVEYGKAGLIEDARKELETELQRTRFPAAVERLIHSLDARNR